MDVGTIGRVQPTLDPNTQVMCALLKHRLHQTFVLGEHPYPLETNNRK